MALPIHPLPYLEPVRKWVATQFHKQNPAHVPFRAAYTEEIPILNLVTESCIGNLLKKPSDLNKIKLKS